MLLVMSKHRCWDGHLFASNVGVLPTEPDGCVLDPRLVLSIPNKDLGHSRRRRRRRLQRELFRCDCNETNDVAPTIDARTQRR